VVVKSNKFFFDINFFHKKIIDTKNKMRIISNIAEALFVQCFAIKPSRLVYCPPVPAQTPPPSSGDAPFGLAQFCVSIFFAGD
jgi:hypothetical protein